jgi:hypothetical protein
MFVIIFFMCEFDNLSKYAQSLEQRGLYEEAAFVRMVERQGGEIRPGLVDLVEKCGDIDGKKAEAFRIAKEDTGNDTHFSGKEDKVLEQSRARFESRYRG